MILPYRNLNSLHKLAGVQPILKRYVFQIALLNSLVLHLIVVSYGLALPAQNKSQLQKPVQLTVQMIKIATPMPIAALMPAEAIKSQMKKAHIPPAKATQNSQPSPHVHLSNNNLAQKHITVPMHTATDSLPALSETEIESPAIASTHLAATSPESTPTVVPVLTLAPVISNAIAPNIAPVKIGVSISASYASSNHKPEYPVMSRRLNEQGTVILKVLVTDNGTAGMVEVKTSSNYPLLDESARNAVMQWHFNPATIDGKPTSEFYSLTIPFKLEE